MVNADGQLYTIEGVAAALILLLTAYIVVNSTSVYTMGDTHISDMQLEVVGDDALKMMNTAPNSSVEKTSLRTIIETGDAVQFQEMFDSIVNAKTGTGRDRIQFMANVTYERSDGTVGDVPLGASSHIFTGREHAVRVTEWVIVDSPCPLCSDVTSGKHAVLVEALVWRD
ncbi:hypothetical protein [Methanoregula sp.]|uniref:DUF7288 family protein n=1 Tax=Methanoregula sp. TaxID=2052170 RepID=UPI000CBD69FF|nr:hypothetical protein [Methanoregula sp.]PKG33553.1 MAG: hypothetical protein CW742_02380 [Methanoregula sp.]